MVCLPVPTGPRVFGALEPDPEERRGRAGGNSGSRSPEAPCPPPWDEESLVQGEGGPKLALLLAFDSGAFSPAGLPFSLGIALNTETVPPQVENSEFLGFT